MAKLLNHELVEGVQTFWVKEDNHHKLVWWALQQHFYPIENEFGPLTDESTDQPMDGVWYNKDIDHQDWEWHFVNRDNQAMLFKLFLEGK